MATTTFLLITSGTFWIAVGSIATAFMAFWTRKTLQKYQKREDEVEHREIIELIIQPVIEELHELVFYFERDFIFMNRDFHWEQIKTKNPYLMSIIPMAIYDLIQDFNIEFNKFNGYAEAVSPKLFEIIADSIRKVVSVSNSVGDKFIAQQSYLRFNLSGKQINVYFHHLILLDMTLDGFKKQKLKDEHIVIKKITGEEFITPGVAGNTPKQFEEVLADLKERIDKEQELAEFLELWRSVYESNKSLRLKLDRFVSYKKVV